MKRIALFGAIGLAMAAALAVGVVGVMPKDSSWAVVRDSGVIRIGYAVEAPYAFLAADGQVTGESPEVAKHVAAKLGLCRVKWRQVEFASLIDELEAGRIDVIAAGMFVTPQRAGRASFSLPTFQVRPGLLTPRGNPRGLHSYRQALALADIKIATLAGSVEEQALRRMGAAPAQLVTVPDALTGRTAVESGAADALALSAPAVRWLAMTGPAGRTEAAEPFHAPREGETGLGAFAFRKADRRLLEAWNAVLADYVGGPQHLALMTRFGFTEAELPHHAPDGEQPSR